MLCCATPKRHVCPDTRYAVNVWDRVDGALPDLEAGGAMEKNTHGVNVQHREGEIFLACKFFIEYPNCYGKREN